LLQAFLGTGVPRAWCRSPHLLSSSAPHTAANFKKPRGEIKQIDVSTVYFERLFPAKHVCILTFPPKLISPHFRSYNPLFVCPATLIEREELSQENCHQDGFFRSFSLVSQSTSYWRAGYWICLQTVWFISAKRLLNLMFYNRNLLIVPVWR